MIVIIKEEIEFMILIIKEGIVIYSLFPLFMVFFYYLHTINDNNY